MSHISHARSRLTSPGQGYPWLVFLVLSITLFFTYHDMTGVHQALEGYNRSADDIVSGVSTGTPTRQVAWLILGAASIVSLTRYAANHPLRFEGMLVRFLLAFAVWAFLSVLWAESLSQTLKRLATLGILCLLATAVVRRFSLQDVITWTFFTTSLYLFVGIAVEIGYGAFHPFAYSYRFAGTQHPNGEGIECGLLFLSGLVTAKSEHQHRKLVWTFTLAGMVFLILTGSRTSFVATLLASAVYGIATSTKLVRARIISAVGVLFCFLVLFVAAGWLPQEALLLGRVDPGSGDVDSFTGRTVIWTDVTPYIFQHPILGDGYGGFWTPEHISVISDEEKWGVPDSHSAYVDYLLTLGGVGLGLYLLCLFAGVWRVVAICWRSQDPTFAFAAGLLVFCIADGFLESAIGEGSLLMFLCMMVLIKVASTPLERVTLGTGQRRTNSREICAV